MAIDTAAKRRAVAHLARHWSGAGVTPTSPATQFWRQNVGRGYGGILATAAAALAFVLDLNTRLHVYLRDYYSLPEGSDTTAMVTRYLNGLSGEMMGRWRQLVQDATDAMT